MADACDCLVLGGGVAGAGLALLLAKAGRSVVLVERGQPHLSGPYETLLAPARTMLARSGFGPAIEACAERDPLRHGALWGEATIAWRDEAEPGLLLRRGPFDAALRAAAAAAGARVCTPALATGHAGRWSIAGPAHRFDVAPQQVVFATGRRVPRPAPAELVSASPPAFAFTFVGTPAEEERGTAVVEAVRSGWIWTHAPHDGHASAAVVVDADELRSRGRAALLADAFAESLGPAGRLQQRRLVRANDATPRLRAPTAEAWCIGDAAATIDPLASQGVEKALAAADHAAALLTTAFTSPGLAPRLGAVQHRWERGLFQAHRQVAGAWYAREPRFGDAPFWRARQPRPGPPGPSRETPLQVATTLRPARILVREGPRFVECDGFVDARTGDEAAHIGYVPIAPLLACFDPPCRLDAAVVRAGQQARLFVLPPRAVHGALQELVRRGGLTPATTATGSP